MRTSDEGKSCTSTFVAAKTLPRYLSFRENFANGGVPVLVSEIWKFVVQGGGTSTVNSPGAKDVSITVLLLGMRRRVV